VPVNGALVVHPTATTVFTLNVYGKPGMEPASIAGEWSRG